MKVFYRNLNMAIGLFVLINSSTAQNISLTGKIVNPDEKPVKKVFVYLVNNPSLYCYSDSLGNFSLTDISTSVTEVRQDNVISFENRKLSVYANNQSIAVDVFTIDGRQAKNIANLRYCLGTFGLYPEAYLSDLPKAIYIVRVIVGNTSQSFKIQNIIPSVFPQGITEYDINNIIDNSFTESKSKPTFETKSEALDTLVLVHDFYKTRKIPIDTYTTHYDSIRLNNFSDYSIAEGFDPAVTYTIEGYANFTDLLSADSVQFIIDYDTLSILEGDLKIITIPVDKIENLDNSIKFISGLHFEPSGIRFFVPVEVYVFMKDSIPEDLVVFQCNDQGETYFIPYKDLLNDGHSISFIINHFSSIGIGTREINLPSDDPETFTASSQFLSYLAEYLRYYESVGSLEPPQIEFFTTWFNNAVAPMISSIITWEDFGEALSEFLLLAETSVRFGLVNSFTNLPFWNLAKEWFCEKMMKIWNELIVDYNRLDNYCLKREILDIALGIIEQNMRLGGKDFCQNLGISESISFEDLFNDFGNGEFYNLVNKIEFSTQVKHLEVGESYVAQYTLECLSGNCIPEVVSWSSSNPSVASVNNEGVVTAHKNGKTTIKARICDIKNTFEVEVGGFNCELDYCREDICYTGIYKGTGAMTYSWSKDWYDCDPTVTQNIYFTLTFNLGTTNVPNSIGTILYDVWSGYKDFTEICETKSQIVRSYDDYFQPTLDCSSYGIGNFYGWYLGQYEFEGTLSGGVLTVTVKDYVSRLHRDVTTIIICTRID